MVALNHAAEAGAAWAVDRLLSRPILEDDARAVYAAFLELSRDRPIESISMGMAGSLTLPRPIPRETIRRDAVRRHYEGDALEDFVEAITRVDDYHVELEVTRAAADAKRAAANNRKR